MQNKFCFDWVWPCLTYFFTLLLITELVYNIVDSMFCITKLYEPENDIYMIFEVVY